MGRERFTPEQIIGKLREGEVPISQWTEDLSSAPEIENP
jgi:hypothetical protein